MASKNNPPGLGHPVRNIFCVGRNYAEHAQEMRYRAPEPDEDPVVFLKPTSALAWGGAPILLPSQSTDVHHEVEVVLALKRPQRHMLGAPIPPEEAVLWVQSVAIGIDVTARDVQQQAKKQGLPWTLAKGLNSFAQVGSFKSVGNGEDLIQADSLGSLKFGLSVNHQERQKANTREMILSIPQLVHSLSKFFSLDTGDLVYTGTPAGVGPLQDGDRIEAWLGPGISEIKTRAKKGTAQ